MDALADAVDRQREQGITDADCLEEVARVDRHGRHHPKYKKG